jgi:MFS family permease
VRLIRESPAFRALFVSRTVSYLGDSLGLVVLMLYVADATGNALAVAVLLLVGDFAPSLLAPLTGVISDRFDLRRVMLACELGQAVLVGVLAAQLPSLPILLALVGLRALAAHIFAPASRSAMPMIVPDDDLVSSNSALGWGTNIAELTGPVLAAALFPALGVRGILALDAATFLVSATLLASLPPLARRSGPAQSMLAEARTGLRYIWTHRFVRTLLLGFCVVVAFNGIDDVALVFLVRDTLGAGRSATALTLAGVGLGLLVGFLVLARLGRAGSMLGIFVIGLAVSSAGNLLTGLSWAVAVVIGVQSLRGLGLAAVEVGSSTLLQRALPAHVTGRVFANLYGLLGAAAALSYLLGALLLNATSPRTTFLVAGTGGMVAAALTGWRLSRQDPARSAE